MSIGSFTRWDQDFAIHPCVFPMSHWLQSHATHPHHAQSSSLVHPESSQDPPSSTIHPIWPSGGGESLTPTHRTILRVARSPDPRVRPHRIVSSHEPNESKAQSPRALLPALALGSGRRWCSLASLCRCSLAGLCRCALLGVDGWCWHVDDSAGVC